MKTSNKILLATFLTVILILVSVHIAIYAKYKKGDYIVMTDDMWPTNMITQSLSDVKYVSIDNVENLIIQTGDSSKLQYDKPEEGEENILSVTRKADTLFLAGKSTKSTIGRWYKRTNLSLSGLLPVRITNSRLSITGSKNSQLSAMDIFLDEAFMEVNNDSQTPLSFSTLKINAVNGSRINLFNTAINSLEVTLKHSFLEETTLNADSIKITTDASSKIQLSGKNLQKAKIISNE